MRYIVAFFLFGSAALWANIIDNGSFEFPNLTGNTTTDVFPAGSSGIPGWTVTDFSPENVSILRSNFTDGNLTFLPHVGDQSLNLTGTFKGEAAGVLQNVTLTPGDQYALTFWIGNQDNSVDEYTLDSVAALYINGNFVSYFTNGDNSHHALNWQEFSYDFTATKAANSIQFQNATLSFDKEVGLDSVDLEDITPMVSTPEPAALTLTALGILMLAYLRRKIDDRKSNSGAQNC